MLKEVVAVFPVSCSKTQRARPGPTALSALPLSITPSHLGTPRKAGVRVPGSYLPPPRRYFGDKQGPCGMAQKCCVGSRELN